MHTLFVHILSLLEIITLSSPILSIYNFSSTILLAGYPTSFLIVILFSVVAMIIILMIITINRIRRNDRRKIIALEQRLLISQMNPHFVFNSLTAIQSYIFRNDPYQAGKYLANFSKLVRLILENSRLEHIKISKEKETIEHYLELQALRFEGKFEYSIDVSSEIDEEHYYIPPMLAQPFIENAIEHGIIHLSNKGLVNIRFVLAEPNIILEVEDNGVGIEKSAEFNSKKREDHKSLATRITAERLRNLKRVYGRPLKMEMIDLTRTSSEGTRGTLVRFTIPLIVK